VIHYNQVLYTLASFDWRDSVSQLTGRGFDYTYYLELCKKHRNGVMSDNEYYDYEISRFKFDINQN
jgi:hypothetical protein